MLDWRLTGAILGLCVRALSGGSSDTGAHKVANVEVGKWKQVEVDNRRVLLIGIGGLRADVLRQVVSKLESENKYPHFLSLFKHGVADYSIYAGGEVGSESEQATKSGPGWATILTGTWANEHKVRNNAGLEDGSFNTRVPTLFNYVGRIAPELHSAACTDWWPLSVFVKHDQQGMRARFVPARASEDLASYFKNDHFMQKEALDLLKEQNLKLLFLYLGSVGKTGETTGFGPRNQKYTESVEYVASLVDNLVEEVQRQRTDKSLEWLVVLCSDHGGKGLVTGGQSSEERSVFVVLQNPANPVYSGGRERASYKGIDSVTPTILAFLDPHNFRAGEKNFKYLGAPLTTAAGGRPTASLLALALTALLRWQWSH